MRKSIIGGLLVAGLALGGAVATVPPPAEAAVVYCDNYVSTGWGRDFTLRAPSTSNGSTKCYLRPSTSYNKGVAQLQRSLLACYPSKIPTAWRSTFVDGYYGAKTTQVLKNVQASLRITADGLYGPTTKTTMNWPKYSGASGNFISCGKPPASSWTD